MWPAVPTISERSERSLFLGGHSEDGLGGLVQLGGQGQPRFLLGSDDEGVVLARHLDEEQQLVAGEVEDDPALLLVEKALDQLVAELETGLLLLFRDEVVFLAGDLLEKDQLFGAI